MPAPSRGPLAEPQPGPRFAELLQRGQATHGVLARPTEAPSSQAQAQPGHRVDGDSDAEAPSAAQPATPTRPTPAGAKPTTRPREKAASSTPPTPRSTSDLSADGTVDDAAAARRQTGEGDASMPTGAAQAADLRDWMAVLKLPDLVAADAADATTRPLDAATGNPTGLGLGAGETTQADPLHSANPNDNPRDDAGGSVGAPDSARFGAPAPGAATPASDERRPASTETHPETTALRDPAQGLLAGVGSTVPRGFDAGTLAPIALPVPVHSPEFAQVLGAQVSVLARDGVQRAELHLNPAEMGPISVQIDIDGKEARVDFSVGAAATREVIERGLPELASALREQGLTLAGGGVFQQPPEARDKPGSGPAGNAGRTRRRGVVEAAPASRAIAVPAAQGTLDLYA